MKTKKIQLDFDFYETPPESEDISFLKGYEYTQYEQLKEIMAIHKNSSCFAPNMHESDIIYGYKTRYQLYNYIEDMYDFAANHYLLVEALLKKTDLSILRFDKNEMPYIFERFCTQLLEFTFSVIGKTTSKSRDGGIDGLLYDYNLAPIIGIQAKFYESKIGSESLRTFKGSLLLSKKPIFFGVLFTTATEATLPDGYHLDNSIILIKRETIIEILKVLKVLTNYIIYYGEIFSSFDINETDLGDICAKFYIIRRIIADKLQIPKNWPVEIRKEFGLDELKIKYWSNINFDNWY